LRKKKKPGEYPEKGGNGKKGLSVKKGDKKIQNTKMVKRKFQGQWGWKGEVWLRTRKPTKPKKQSRWGKRRDQRGILWWNPPIGGDISLEIDQERGAP